MKLPVFLFLVLLVLCALYGTFLVIEAPPNAAGLGHDTYDTMQRGGDGRARHSPVLNLAWTVGVLQICLFLGFVFLGLGRKKSRLARRPLLVGGAAFLAVFSLLVLAYRRYMSDPALAAERLFLSFPAPTAWMLYGVWTVPVVFILLYIFRFDDWIYTPEDAARFEHLLSKRRDKDAS